jgi:stalled ribosome rescue protein Dom34
LSRLKALILAGPDSSKEELHARFLKAAITDDKKSGGIKSIKSKILIVTCPSGQPNALQDQLKDPKIVNLLSDTKNSQESKLMDTFHKLLESESNEEGSGRKVLFGDYQAIYRWAKEGAIKDLLLSDKVFR